MNTLKQILIIIVLLIVASFLYTFAKVNKPVATPVENAGEETVEVDTTDWVTYVNQDYGFEIMHPQDWRIATSGHPAEPIINIYPETETEKPPFIHHNFATNVSIFPGGVPTEGIFGGSATSTVAFTEPIRAAIDFTLADGGRWGTYAVFQNPGPKWQQWGFIWSRAPIANYREFCLDTSTNTEIPMNSCDFMSNPALTIVREGTLNEEVRQIETEMLKSFKFIR